MFISYAQNCEDVVLWRALQHIEHGRYVDVGAADPTDYSVTKAFYDRGWTGVNVEPAPEFAERLRAERTHDTTVQLCAGEFEGPMTLHYVPGTGLSTVSDEFLATITDQQFEIVNLESEVRRLDRILDEAGLGGKDIHFLKVDVEGAEETVLRSIDFSVWRPWVVVVEATEPLSTAQTHASWDSLLTDNGYVFCLFDGLNRFYAASERTELQASLSYPACVWDQPYTVGAGDHELAARAEQLVMDVDEWSVAYQRLSEQFAGLSEGHERLQHQYGEALAGYDRLKLQLEESLVGYGRLHGQYDEALDGYNRLHEEYDNTLSAYQRLVEHCSSLESLQGSDNRDGTG